MDTPFELEDVLTQDTISRSLHDVGLAAWFGGTLANAVALNPAAAEADTADGTGRVANTGWNKWTPVNAAAIGAHLAGSVGELVGNRSRLRGHRGGRARRQPLPAGAPARCRRDGAGEDGPDRGGAGGDRVQPVARPQGRQG